MTNLCWTLSDWLHNDEPLLWALTVSLAVLAPVFEFEPGTEAKRQDRVCGWANFAWCIVHCRCGLSAPSDGNSLHDSIDWGLKHQGIMCDSAGVAVALAAACNISAGVPFDISVRPNRSTALYVGRHCASCC
jgi:hypothetical protein